MKHDLRPMHITHDPEADAAYIYVRYPVAPGEVARTVPVDLPENCCGMVNLDLDEAGRLLGVEVIGAKGMLGCP